MEAIVIAHREEEGVFTVIYGVNELELHAIKQGLKLNQGNIQMIIQLYQQRLHMMKHDETCTCKACKAHVTAMNSLLEEEQTTNNLLEKL